MILQEVKSSGTCKIIKKLYITLNNACIDPSWAAIHGENPISEHSRNDCADSRHQSNLKVKPQFLHLPTRN